MLEKIYWIIKVFSIPCIVLLAAMGIAQSDAEIPEVEEQQSEPLIDGQVIAYDIELVAENGQRLIYLHGLRRQTNFTVASERQNDSPWQISFSVRGEGGFASLDCDISHRAESRNLGDVIVWSTKHANVRLQLEYSLEQIHKLESCKDTFGEMLTLRVQVRGPLDQTDGQ